MTQTAQTREGRRRCTPSQPTVQNAVDQEGRRRAAEHGRGRRRDGRGCPHRSASAPTTTRSTPSTTRRACRSADHKHPRAGWGQHGYHYKDATGELKEHDAQAERRSPPALSQAAEGRAADLRDHGHRDQGRPGGHLLRVRALGLADGRGGHVHETPAEQDLRWRAVLDVPEEPRSCGTPGKPRAGARPTVDLPVPDVNVTTAPVTLPPAPADGRHRPARRARAMMIVRDLRDARCSAGTVKVVDGPHTGDDGRGRGGRVAEHRGRASMRCQPRTLGVAGYRGRLLAGYSRRGADVWAGRARIAKALEEIVAGDEYEDLAAPPRRRAAVSRRRWLPARRRTRDAGGAIYARGLALTGAANAPLELTGNAVGLHLRRTTKARWATHLLAIG